MSYLGITKRILYSSEKFADKRTGWKTYQTPGGGAPLAGSPDTGEQGGLHHHVDVSILVHCNEQAESWLKLNKPVKRTTFTKNKTLI